MTADGVTDAPPMPGCALLDTGPLGMITNPRITPGNLACNAWLQGLLNRGARVCIPEIADYEVRRELLRAGRTNGLRRLDGLQHTLDYLSLTTEVMVRAAVFWAVARQQGQPTAADPALDGDVILAAQAASVGARGYRV